MKTIISIIATSLKFLHEMNRSYSSLGKGKPKITVYRFKS